MKKILLTLLIIFSTCLPAIAATGDILAVRIVGSTPTAGITCNGWVAEIDLENLSTGGAYDFGLGANNDPSTAKVVFSVRSPGYDATGTFTYITRTVYGTYWLRKPYPNQASKDEVKVSTTLTVRIALSDFIYAGDDQITVNIASGFYTGIVAKTGISVTNNSTLTHPKSVGRWAWASRERITTDDFLVEMVGFHRSAINGKPLASVKITAIGETSAASVTKTISNMTVSTRTGDANKVLVYAATFTSSDWTSFTQGETIRFRFQCYPWVGNSGSVLDSETTGDGVAQPDARMGPFYAVLDKTGAYGLAFAVVDPINGRDSSASTWVYATQSSAETAYAGDNTLSYKYIGRATAALKSYNNTNYTRNEPGNGSILLTAGTHDYPGYDNSSGYAASSTWTTIVPMTGVSRANAIIHLTWPVTQSGISKLKLSGVSLYVASAGMIYGSGNAIDELWVHNCSWNLTGLSVPYFGAWKAGYFTQNAIVNTDQDIAFSSLGSPVLVRGNEKTGAAVGAEVRTIIGNKQVKPGTWVDSGTYISDNSVVAFNTVYAWGADLMSAGILADLTKGNALVQNVFEASSGSQPLISIGTGIGAVGNNTVNNFILWHNTIAGNRANLGYNESTNGIQLRTKWSVVGNMFDDWNNKGDEYINLATNVGGFSVKYNVGSYGNAFWYIGFPGDFMGLNSKIYPPAATLGYVDDNSAATGDGTGNGNYHLTASSDGRSRIPLGRAVLPFDLEGKTRSNTGAGSSGAYEYSNTYYVDYTDGHDSATGLNPTTNATTGAWKTAPGSSTNSTVLVPGDTVIFKGGVIYQDTIDVGFPYLPSGAGAVVNITTSGTDDTHRITYDGNTAGTFGTGKAVIDGSGTQYRGFYFNGARSYITITGFQFQNFNVTSNYYSAPSDENANNMAGVGNGTSGSPVSSHYITVSYNDFFKIGDNTPPYRDAGGGDAGYMRTGLGVYNGGGNNWKINNNTFTDCGATAVGLVDSNDTEVYNNTLTGTMTWPVFYIRSQAGTGTGFKFHDNTIHDTNLLYIPTRGTHADVLYIFTSDHATDVKNLTNIQVYNNYFYNSTYPRATGGATGFIYIETNAPGTMDGIYLFNNVFFNPENSLTVLINNRVSWNPYATIKNVYMSNNTTYINGDQSALTILNAVCNSAYMYNFYIRNNIVAKANAGGTNYTHTKIPQVATIGSAFLFDHNSYYNVGTTGGFLEDGSVNGSNCGGSAIGYTFSGWQGLSVGGGSIFDPAPSNSGTNPNFISVVPGSQNLHLTSGSTSVIGNGANLSSLCDTIFSSDSTAKDACKKDRDGVSRGTAWDIGAYQYVGIPAEWDWRNVGGVNYISDVRNQSVPNPSANTCIAHAVIAVIEAKAVINGVISRADANFAEQVFSSCCYIGGEYCGGLTWGYQENMLIYARDTGVPLESCIPYLGGGYYNGYGCVSPYVCSSYLSNVYKISSYTRVTPVTIANLKSTIYTYGPITAEFNTCADYHAWDGTGIYNYNSGGGCDGSHAVAVVGYVDTGTTSTSYFITKDSYGSSYSESGFQRIGFSNVGTAVDFAGTSWYVGTVSHVGSVPTLQVVTGVGISVR